VQDWVPKQLLQIMLNMSTKFCNFSPAATSARRITSTTSSLPSVITHNCGKIYLYFSSFQTYGTPDIYATWTLIIVIKIIVTRMSLDTAIQFISSQIISPTYSLILFFLHVCTLSSPKRSHPTKLPTKNCIWTSLICTGHIIPTYSNTQLILGIK
jgi:hypothetical protein